MSKEKKPLTKKKLIFSIIGYVVSFLCLILCIYIVTEVLVANKNKRPPRVFNLSISYIPTGSMEPTIHQGSYILFSKTNYNSVKIDDIVVYYSSEESKYIIHRVIGIVKDGELINDSRYESYYDFDEDLSFNHLICKGDANALADKVDVTKDILYGRYITELKFMQLFSGGINSNVIFIIILLIFFVVIGMQISQIILKQKAEKAKEDAEKAKEDMLAELRRQVLEEELLKIKNSKDPEENKPLEEKVDVEDEFDASNDLEADNSLDNN